MFRLFTLTALIFTFTGPAPVLAEQKQCFELLQTKTDPGVYLSPKTVLLDLASRLETLMSQLSDREYIKTDRLRYMKAMVLETTALNEYYGDLYAQLFPEEPELAQGFKERQGFLEALNIRVSAVAKYRDLEKWLLEEQNQAQRQGAAAVKAYQVLRDELNLIYYQLLAELHAEMLGQKEFHFQEPVSWKAWFANYVGFLAKLPAVDKAKEQNHLLNFLAESFRTLHGQMAEIQIEGLEKLTPQEVEGVVHDIRRQIRWVNIILLKNSQWVQLQEVEHDWLELDNSVIEGALVASGYNSRYIKLNPPATGEPILFPQLSFFAINFFTAELGSIKDHLEQVLFFEEIKTSLRQKIRAASSPAREDAMKLAIKLSSSHSLSKRSRDFLRVVKDSYLFLYTSSWLREFNLKF